MPPRSISALVVLLLVALAATVGLWPREDQRGTAILTASDDRTAAVPAPAAQKMAPVQQSTPQDARLADSNTPVAAADLHDPSSALAQTANGSHIALAPEATWINNPELLDLIKGVYEAGAQGNYEYMAILAQEAIPLALPYPKLLAGMYAAAGMGYQNAGYKDKAIGFYRQALEVDPTHAQSYAALRILDEDFARFALPTQHELMMAIQKEAQLKAAEEAARGETEPAHPSP